MGESSEPSHRDLRVVIIGAGMAGIMSAIELREAGYEDVEIYEKAERLGGTWRENTYPGIACDVPSHLYSYSFEPNPDWSHRYSPGGEIQAYFERVADKYHLERLIRYGEEVVRCDYVNDRWRIETSAGRRDEADVLIAATGVLHHPFVPELPGLAHFEGEWFHSARWNHDVALEGTRIGIIGTGSTAIQIVSAAIDRVESLSLFQRTAQWIMPQQNPAYSDAERLEFREHPEKLRSLRADISNLFAGFANAIVDADSEVVKGIQLACEQNLEQNVHDPDLRERLRPNYRAACKRLVISPDFYEAIQKPNATLVTEPIKRIEAKGIRCADGSLHELDVLVLATGFRVDRFLRPTKVTGRGGVRLDNEWADRPSAYLSISVPGFPNLFLLNGPNGPVGNFSLIEVAELQMDYILQLMELLRTRRCGAVNASKAATREFDEARVEAARKTVWVTGCNSWYLDDRGVPAVWPWTFDRFREQMSAPDLDCFELTP